jgi:hypothetical protein
MIHDHTNKLGGPNADVLERIKAMNKPKLVQPPTIFPEIPPVFDEVAVHESAMKQIRDLCGQAEKAGHHLAFYGVKIEANAHLTEDAYIFKNDGRVVGIGSFKTGKFTAIDQDFPPKHLYEPVTESSAATPITDYVGCPTGIVHFGEKKRFL